MRRLLVSYLVVALVILGAGVSSAKAETTYQGKVYWLYGEMAPTSISVTMNSQMYTVHISSTTSVVNENGVPISVGSFWAGDSLTFIGNPGSYPLTINASLVRNETIADRSVANQPIIAEMVSLFGDTAPTTIAVSVSGVIYTVKVTTATTLQTSSGRQAKLGQFWKGDDLRITGTVESGSPPIIHATTIRNLRLP